MELNHLHKNKRQRLETSEILNESRDEYQQDGIKNINEQRINQDETFSNLSKSQPKGNRNDESQTKESQPHALSLYNQTNSTKNEIEVLFLSQDLVAINKPHNLNIDGELHANTVESILQSQLPDLWLPKNNVQCLRKLKFIHQLDYATSGVLIMAMTRKSCSNVAKCFQDRSVRKKYSAIVHGWIDESLLQRENDILIIESFIDDDHDDEHKFKMKWYDIHDSNRKGKHAKTKVFVQKRGYIQNEKVTHVHLELVTGRRHQLRVHLARIGHPIVGDQTYKIISNHRIVKGNENIGGCLVKEGINESIENERQDHGNINEGELQRIEGSKGEEPRLLLHSLQLEVPLDLNENKIPYQKEHGFPCGKTILTTKDPFQKLLH